MTGRPFSNSTLLSALALFLTAVLSPTSAMALDSWDVETATQEVHDSIDATNAVFNGLPEQTRRSLNADIRLLTHSITRSVERLESQSPSIIHHAVVHNLHFLTDVVHTVSYELRTLDSAALVEVNGDMSKRLAELSTVASDHISQIDNTLDEFEEVKSEFIIKTNEFDELIKISYLNRLSMDTVRYMGILLFLVGILVVAILIKVEKDRQPIGEFFLQRSHFSSKLLLTIFFLSCLFLTTLPGTLVGLSANTEVLAKEDPCQSLQTQSSQLGTVQRLDNAKLIELTKQRMEMAAADCLGVAEATAAVERLAAKAVASLATQSLLSARERESTSTAARNVHITAETREPEAPPAESLPDLLDANTWKNPDRTAAAKSPPPQSVKTSDSPALVAPPKAKDSISGEALQKEIVRDAMLTKRTLQEKNLAENGSIKTTLISQEPKIIYGLDVKAQKSDDEDEMELYLHFRSQDDRDLVEELGDLLREEGYEVAGIQLVEDAMTPGDIRYRHQDHEEEVENIQAVAEKHLNKYSSKEKINLHAVYIGNIYPEKPKNRIELWIPQLRGA